jgi:hypothetical protein
MVLALIVDKDSSSRQQLGSFGPLTDRNSSRQTLVPLEEAVRVRMSLPAGRAGSAQYLRCLLNTLSGNQ